MHRDKTKKCSIAAARRTPQTTSSRPAEACPAEEGGSRKFGAAAGTAPRRHARTPAGFA